MCYGSAVKKDGLVQSTRTSAVVCNVPIPLLDSSYEEPMKMEHFIIWVPQLDLGTFRIIRHRFSRHDAADQIPIIFRFPSNLPGAEVYTLCGLLMSWLRNDVNILKWRSWYIICGLYCR